MSSDQNFQVNLGGVIRLLSDHLYGGPEVFIRELLQNSIDAITARRKMDASYSGRIRVEVLTSDRGNTVCVEDDGIGLTESEVHQFLATIGESSKSGDLSRGDFIGQFGIGLLSAFVVSDEITVLTQSARDSAQSVQWTGRANGTYAVTQLSQSLPVGTQVFLRSRSGKEEFFEPERVQELLRYFGHHLPWPIEFHSKGTVSHIAETAPWRQAFASDAQRRETLLRYGRATFGPEFLDAVPLRSETGSVDGVAFVLPFTASPASRHTHRVYLKNMLLTESASSLLPEWAFFVRCVINADRLRPNAARDAFYKDDSLEKTQLEIGRCLKDYLISLSQFDRRRLEQLIRLHYLPIKSLATEDEEFYRLFIRWLPFETTTGSVTLEEYFQSNKSLRYVKDVDQFRQIASVASAQGLCLFNGGYAYDAELLDKLPEEFPGHDIRPMEASELVQDFEELSLEESQQVFDLIKLADVVLQKYKCRVEARRFVPAELPALYTANHSARFLRSVEQSTEVADDMWSGILNNVAAAVGADGYAQLVLNFRNPLIRKLTEIPDKPLLKRIIEVLYLQSLLLGHYPLSSEERKILGSGLLGLIEHFLANE